MSEPSDRPGAGHSQTPGVVTGRARTGVLWIVGGFGSGQVLRLIANVALASILFEEAFALMAIVSGVMMGLAMFSDIGLGTSVVQHPRGDDPEFLETAWTLQVLRGVGLFLVALILAWPVSRIYGANDPKAFDLLYLIPITALTALTDGFKSVRVMTASRHLRLKELTLIELIAGPFNVVVMLALAWYMRSVYALAIAAVLTSFLQSVLSYTLLKGPRSRLRWDMHAARSILNFGKWVFLSTLITFMAMQVDRLTMAGMYPLAEVGVYSIAASLAIIVPTVVGKLQLSVLFPWYSRMLEQGMSLPAAFGKTRNAMMIFSTFLCTLLISGAGSFFSLAYDHRYAMGGVLLPILALGAWFSCLENMYGAAFVASGRPKWIAITNATKVVSFVVLLAPLLLFDLSITVAALFLAGCEVLRWLLCQRLGVRLGLRNARAEALMLAGFLTVSAIGWWLVEKAPVISQLPPFWRLVVLGVVETLLFAPLFLRFVLPLIRGR